MIYDPYLLQPFIILFGLAVGLAWLFFRIFRKDVRGKLAKPYMGGEDLKIDEVSVSPVNFYASIERTLRVKRLRDLHNGDLSRYVTWIIIGLSIFMIVLVWGL